MSKTAKKRAPSNTQPKAEEDAWQMAKRIQKPGQTKEQTKMVAQGIKKGIELYKKEQSAKAREQDKKRKQASKQQTNQTEQDAIASTATVEYKQHWLPWLLLILSWAGIGGYLVMLG